MTTKFCTTHTDRTSWEITGARTFAGRMRRFRIGNEAGEVFEPDEEFEGHTLTVEITDGEDGEGLLRILGGWGEADPPAEVARDLIRRLAYALDPCLPALRRAAGRERAREEGKPLRSVTEQQRADMAEAAVREAFVLLGLEEPAP